MSFAVMNLLIIMLPRIHKFFAGGALVIIIKVRLVSCTKEEKEMTELLFKRRTSVRDLYFASDNLREKMRRSVVKNNYYFSIDDVSQGSINTYLKSDSLFTAYREERKKIDKKVVRLEYVDKADGLTRVHFGFKGEEGDETKIFKVDRQKHDGPIIESIRNTLAGVSVEKVTCVISLNPSGRGISDLFIEASERERVQRRADGFKKGEAFYNREKERKERIMKETCSSSSDRDMTGMIILLILGQYL